MPAHCLCVPPLQFPLNVYFIYFFHASTWLVVLISTLSPQTPYSMCILPFTVAISGCAQLLALLLGAQRPVAAPEVLPRYALPAPEIVAVVGLCAGTVFLAITQSYHTRWVAWRRRPRKDRGAPPPIFLRPLASVFAREKGTSTLRHALSWWMWVLRLAVVLAIGLGYPAFLVYMRVLYAYQAVISVLFVVVAFGLAHVAGYSVWWKWVAKRPV